VVGNFEDSRRLLQNRFHESNVLRLDGSKEKVDVIASYADVDASFFT
jgi:hypothetical protein